MDNTHDLEKNLRNFDKILLGMGLPMLLVLLGSLILNQDEDAMRSFWLFVGHSFLLLVMMSEKKAMLENGKGRTRNFLAWFVFTFGIGCFLWNEGISAIVGLVIAILATTWKTTTNPITFLLWIGWIMNMYVCFTSALPFVDQLIYLFSANIWQANAWKLALVAVVFLIVLAFVYFLSGTKDTPATRENKENKSTIQNPKNTIHISVPDHTKNVNFVSRISLISDQEAIDHIHKLLTKVEQFINMNLTSDAAANLRLVSELFTKQISLHNRLNLEKMDQFSRVKSLYDRKYISKELYSLLSTIRKLGNTAVHEVGDDDRFNKNGLLKLRRQFLEHVSDWIINDQNEVATSVEEDSNQLDSETDYDYKYEYQANEDKIVEEFFIDADDEDEDEDENEYFDQDAEDGLENEQKEYPQRYSVSMILPKEKREKMKF